MKVEFDEKKLEPFIKTAYQKIIKEHLGTEYGDPHEIALRVFEPFEGPEWKSDSVKMDLLRRDLLF